MTIGVFFGGKSPEHDVSIITGQLVISELKKNLNHKVVAVYLDKNGFWYLGDSLGSAEFFCNENFSDKLLGLDKYSIDLEKSRGQIVFCKHGFMKSEIGIDFAFPAFHGMNGEDGTIQGLFEMFNIPYSGCGVESSALSMDKIMTKVLYRANNIKTPNYIYFSSHDWRDNQNNILDRICNELHFPLFVKPPKLGSSIGISRVRDRRELKFGIEVALHYGERVLVENGVDNLVDLTCALVGNDDPTISLVQESLFSSDFFGYNEKYLDDGGAQTGNAQKNIFIPARISDGVAQLVRDRALAIYQAFNCSGMARVDFLYDRKHDELYASEVNAIPGTLYHHLWKASGIELNDLIERLINLGIEKHKDKNSHEYIFKSNVLSMMKSVKLQKPRD